MPTATDKPAFKPKQKPPVIGTEKVKCQCGHEAVFELFPDKQDRFRNERRKKLTDRPCPECRVQEHERKMAEQAGKRASESKKAPKPNPNAAMPPIARLPDKSVFHAEYDAATKTWTGSLTIEGTPFSGTFSGIMKLLQGLDRKYREALKAVADQSEEPQA